MPDAPPAADAALRSHLVEAGLAGRVQTPPSNVVGNCERLVAGQVDHTFGLSDWRDATLPETVEAVRSVCGAALTSDAHTDDGPGWIDPDATLRGVVRHRAVLADAARAGVRVLLATGHPTGLLGHYAALARRLQQAGCTVLAPLDDTVVRTGSDGRSRAVRYVDGVACVSDGGSLRHTHLPDYMEALLDRLGGGPGAVDLVVADHGMAGAAIERGVDTLSIADVNDVALPLAQLRGRTDAVLPIDDNLAPRLFVPVTAAMLAW